MQKRRVLALAMAAVMGAASVPGSALTAIASEEISVPDTLEDIPESEQEEAAALPDDSVLVDEAFINAEAINSSADDDLLDETGEETDALEETVLFDDSEDGTSILDPDEESQDDLEDGIAIIQPEEIMQDDLNEGIEAFQEEDLIQEDLVQEEDLIQEDLEDGIEGFEEDVVVSEEEPTGLIDDLEIADDIVDLFEEEMNPEKDEDNFFEDENDISEDELSDGIVSEGDNEVSLEFEEEDTIVTGEGTLFLGSSESGENTVTDAGNLSLGTPKHAASTTFEESLRFSFTPEKDGVYVFYSSNLTEGDPYADLYDENAVGIAYDDDSYGDHNFSIEAYLKAEKTYYLVVRDYGDDTFDYYVNVDIVDQSSITGLTLNYNGYYSTTPGREVVLEVFASSPDRETEITYQWEKWEDDISDYEELVGEDEPELRFTAEKDDEYRCIVRQGTDVEYAYFYIKVSTGNGFYAYAKDHVGTFRILYGSSVDLEIDAGCDEGSLYFEWTKYHYDEDDHYISEPVEAQEKLHLSSVTEDADYYVDVWDDYGNMETVYFDVTVIAKLEVINTCNEIDVPLGETVTLYVEVVSPDEETPITYQWAYYDETYHAWISIPGETGSSYTTPQMPYLEYMCIVKQGESKDNASFLLSVDTGFFIEQYSYSLSYPVGSTVDLIPAVSGSLPITMKWYKEGTLLDVSSEILTVKTEKAVERYQCEASDGYNSGTIYFTIRDTSIPSASSDTPESAMEIKEGEVKQIQAEAEKSVYLKFVPEVTGEYLIYSIGGDDTYGYLLDENTDTIDYNDDGYSDDEDAWRNFMIDATLEKGKIYYIRVREYDNNSFSCYVTVELNCNHVSDAGKVTKAATCVAAGVKTYTCTICGKVLRTETIPATGNHTWGAWTTTKAATCTAAGTQTRTCSVCKKQETRAIAAKGHTAAADAAVAATCTTAGKTAGSHCSVCGTVLKAQTAIPATGHKWDAGKVTKYATTKATGVKTYTCTVCGAAKTETIPKLSAKEAEGDAKDPKSVAGTVKAMEAVKDNGEPKGSSFAKIQLQSKKQTKNSISLSWNKVSGASGYLLFGNRCGSKNKLVRITKTTSNSYAHKKLKKGTYYKFTVSAYKIVDGKEQVIATSKVIHVATKGGKVTNVKKVTATVKKKAVSKVSLKARKKITVSAKETLQSKKLKLKRHRKIKYESSNSKIAAVNAKGKITAKKKGTCYIYVYSQTGVYAKVKVTVK